VLAMLSLILMSVLVVGFYATVNTASQGSYDQKLWTVTGQ
jgi:hypothetical protein